MDTQVYNSGELYVFAPFRDKSLTGFMSRINQIREKLIKKKIPAALVTGASDLFYLTGFQQEGYWGLITRDKFYLLLPPLLFRQGINHFRSYQAKDLLGGEGLNLLSGKDHYALLSKVIEKEKLKIICFDPEKITFEQVEKLRKVSKFRPSKGLVSESREVKDTPEIEFIRQACRLAIRGFNYAKKILCPGMKERELANKIEYYLKSIGSEKMAFEIIVAGGRNTAYPHHLTSNYIFQRNDIVLIDLGVKYRGYASDLTRTIFLGKIQPFAKRVYTIVRKAHEEAIKKVRPGILTREVGHVARAIIKQSGFGKYFVHNTGHGVGIDIHERPYLTPKSRKILKPGMVFTIEPGIYIPEKFGIRIEDVIHVTEKGYEILTKL